MLNTVYRLVAPRTIEPVQVEIIPEETELLVRPTYLSICNADARYFYGRRDAETLARKLPMALIHEGIGKVVWSRDGAVVPGTRVVMLPNAPETVDDVIAENYLPSSRFCGSGHDGFMRELVALPLSRAIEVPPTVSDEVAAFTEMMSVAMHAVRRFSQIAHCRRETIGVWGDGNMAFFVSLTLKAFLPDSRIVVVGHNRYKLVDFTFADRTTIASEVEDGFSVDHAFECCGGTGSIAAIDQIIDSIAPEGTVSLLGVSENPVPINTRMVLEKGLRVFGSSRSGYEDFADTLKLYERHPEILGYSPSMVGDVVDVSSVADMTRAFEIDIRKSMGKTIMRWNV